MTAERRFTTANPCPICSGGKDMPQGIAERCAGFMSEDGRFAYCTREERAGDLERNDDTSPPSYAHRLDGDCPCNLPHGAHLNGHASYEASGVRIRRKRTQETGALAWFARHTGLDESFLASLDDVEADGEELRFTFRDLRAEHVRIASDDEKRIFWRNAVVPPPIWPIPADALPEAVVLTEGEPDCCTFRYCGFDAFAHVLLERGQCLRTQRSALSQTVA